MNKNISIPNPFVIILSMKPWVKCILILSITAILIASMYFGCFDTMWNSLFGAEPKL